MGSVLRIIKKNFKLLMRSRSSALMIILGPLLVIALVGLAFNNSNAYEVGVGVYSESYSDVSQAIVGALEEQNFMVRMYGDILTCKQGVRQGK